MTATQPHLTFDTRAEQIRRAFEAFHTANPHVWKLFEQFALETIFAGHKHFSADSICHRIRWETDVVTRGSTLKINDHFTAYYARMFHAAHPEHAGFFRNRVLPSKHQPACEPDQQAFIGQQES